MKTKRILPLVTLALLWPCLALSEKMPFPAAIKTLGEHGGNTKQIVSLIGEPKYKTVFIVNNPETYMTGIRPFNCLNVVKGEKLAAWSYQTEGEGFYQLIIRKNELVCLRWNPANNPFEGIPDA